MDKNVRLRNVGNSETEVWYDGEYLGSINSNLSESEKTKEVNELINSASNSD